MKNTVPNIPLGRCRIHYERYSLAMESESQKTGIIYARVSSWEQVSNTSLERQVRECSEYAERNGITIIAEPFIEEGESAKSADRTQFQKALSFCATKKNKVGYLIVHKVDRFARNQDDHVVTRAFLKRYGVQLRSVMEPIDESTIGRLQEGILSVFAEFDNNVRAERSKNGMIEKVKKGIWVWRPPLGYKRLTKGGNIVPEEETAHYIQLIFEEYSKGTYSFQALSDFMEKRGFRTSTGKKPCAQLMEKILRNPAYFGTIRAWGHEIRSAFPAIISEELYWKCQPQLRSRFALANRSITNPAFPLRKFTICPECGSPLTGSFSTGRKGVKYPYYHHQKQSCSVASFIPKESLEQSFVEFLQDISPRARNEKLFKAVVVDLWQRNYKKLDEDNARVRKDIENLESERQRVFDMHRSGRYSDEEFLEQKNLVNIQIQQKKNLLDDKRIEEFNMDEALTYCFNYVRESGKTWKKLEKLPAIRARFQKTAFPEKITFDGRKFGTSKMSLVYELNQEKHPKKSQMVI